MTDRETKMVQLQIVKVKNDSLETTRGMISRTEEMRNLGAGTLREMSAQGDQLNGIEKAIDVIHNDLQQSDRHMKKITTNRVTRYFAKLFGSAKVSKKDPWRLQEEEKVKDLNKKRKPPAKIKDLPNKPSPVGVIKTGDPFEDEMLENLNLVSDALSDMRNMAIDMGSELDRQNEQVGRINDKINANSGTMFSLKHEADKML